MPDRTAIETVAEALAGVTITDPDFDGLEGADWRELAEAALKAVRAVDAEAPEGADLAYLSDRARAYAVGLEARLKTLRQENDELRAKLADPSQRDAKAIRGAYERGWSDCAANLATKTQDAIRALTRCHDAALAATLPDQLARIDAILARSDHACEPSFCDWKRDIRDIREVRGL